MESTKVIRIFQEISDFIFHFFKLFEENRYSQFQTKNLLGQYFEAYENHDCKHWRNYQQEELYRNFFLSKRTKITRLECFEFFFSGYLWEPRSFLFVNFTFFFFLIFSEIKDLDFILIPFISKISLNISKNLFTNIQDFLEC